MHVQKKSPLTGDIEVTPREEHYMQFEKEVNSSMALKFDVHHYVNWSMHGCM